MSKQIQPARPGAVPEPTVLTNNELLNLKAVQLPDDESETEDSELSGEVLDAYAETATLLLTILLDNGPNAEAVNFRNNTLERYLCEYRADPAEVHGEKRANLSLLLEERSKPVREKPAAEPINEPSSVRPRTLAAITETVGLSLTEPYRVLTRRHMTRMLVGSYLHLAQADIVSKALMLRARGDEIGSAMKELDSYTISLLLHFDRHSRDLLYSQEELPVEGSDWAFLSHMVHSFKRFAYIVLEYGRPKTEFESFTSRIDKRFEEFKNLVTRSTQSSRPVVRRSQSDAKRHRSKIVDNSIKACRKGPAHARYLDFYEALIPREWIDAGCPPTNVKAYTFKVNGSYPFRHRIQDEKTKAARRNRSEGTRQLAAATKSKLQSKP